MRKFIILLTCFIGFGTAAFAGNVSGLPSTPDKILGTGRLSSDEMAMFIVTANPYVDYDFATRFAELYIKESAAEGVNHDVAFSQMCLETGFLNFDKIVAIETNNFGGIGAISEKQPGEEFPSILLGVRAQIQHLKAYASAAPLAQERADPRYFNVRFGSAPTVSDLSGKWSLDTAYGQKLKSAMQDIYQMAFAPNESPQLVQRSPR